MQLNEILLIQISLAIPLLAALFAAIIPHRNVRDSLIVLTAMALPYFIYNICAILLSGTGDVEWRLFDIIPGISLYFKIEALGAIFAGLLSILFAVSLLYSVGYMRANKEIHLRRFFAFFCVSIFATLGVAFAGNLLTLFIFYELLTFSTYPLITHNRTDKTKKVGRLYLGTLTGLSVLFFLPAMIFTFNVSGTLEFTNGGILTDKIPPIATMILFALFIFGIAKTAIMPINKWLPAAMVAPTPVSALLHAVAVVKAGLFTVLKVAIYIFGVDNLAKISSDMGDYGDWLIYLAGFTIIMASIIALSKDNFKARLAYSTISQLSYVMLAVGMFAHKAIIAAIFQILAHGFAKFVMFTCAGNIYTKLHKKKISELAGVGRSMPITMGCFSIAAISLIGLPGAGGFFVKWNIFDAAIGAEQFFIVAIIATSTMFNAAYFLPIIYNAYFEKEKPRDGVVTSYKFAEAPLPMILSTCISAFIVILLFAWPDEIMQLAEMVGK